jgi:uncharacterized protein YdiU (UPF0061 family)
MHSLGIPTTRALSVVGSDLPIRRETLETAAVCARIAPSFIRIGHFEHYSTQQNIVRLKELADMVMKNHYPECMNAKSPYLDLFKKISSHNAGLVAQWQAVGFCHGVLNSDNISALGLTMDYGPFGFIDYFQIDHICNHSDHGGRYSYHRQPQIMHWNMACLASAMLPLLELQEESETAMNQLRSALDEFSDIYTQKWQALFREKLGFKTIQDDDIKLLERLLQLMHDSRVDFTSFFRTLGNIRSQESIEKISLRNHFVNREPIDQWFSDYVLRLKSENSVDEERKLLMNKVNPKFILRNHLAQRAIEFAQRKDFSEVKKLNMILSNPFDEQLGYDEYADPPPPELQSIEVSCSS